MTSRPIPRDEWAAFLDSFSRSHEGWLCALEITEENAPPVVAALDVPLAGMTLREHDGGCVISIDVGTRGATPINHVVREPVAIGVDMTEHGEDEGLHITAAHHTARLRFRVAALPETLDGIVLP